jgi:hypothetical protein
MEGKIEGTGKIKQLLDDLKETGRYWKLNEIALVCSLWQLALEEAMDLSHDRLCEGGGGDDGEDDGDDDMLIQMIDLVGLTSNQSFSHHSLK